MSMSNQAVREKLLEDPDIEQVLIKTNGQVHVKTYQERGDNGQVPWWMYRGQVEDVAAEMQD